MADPMFDNFARIIRGEASPATMRFWMGGNLHLDRISGWSSENLALAAWLAELRARMKENAPEPQLAEMRGLIRARFERERDGNYQGIEVYGRVYGLWNYVVRLALYRFCLRPGTAWVKDGRAVAAREGREPVSMPLPGGTVLFDATIAPEGLQLTIPSAAGGESPPPPIAPPAPDSAPGRPGYRSSDRRRNVALGAWVAAVLGSLLGRWLGRKKEETK